MEYQVNDIAIMKKEHPCDSRSTRWKIIRVGADIKLRCLGCERIIMLTKYKFEKGLKKIEKQIVNN